MPPVDALTELVRAALKSTAAAADRVRRPAPGVTVLLYHRVGAGSASQVDLEPGRFADQMAELAESGRVCTLDDALGVLAAGPRPEVDPVVVTFDDGTPDLVEVALPVLVRHRIPVVLYVATRYVDEGLPFWSPDDRALSWGALAEAVSTGLVEVGSHTHSHALLDRLDTDAVHDELDRSIDLIGANLGVTARHFAYPKALPPAAGADAAVRERFVSAALAGTRPNPYGATDPYRLARSPVQRSDGMRWFRHKVDGGMGLEDRLRVLANRRRYAGAVS